MIKLESKETNERKFNSEIIEYIFLIFGVVLIAFTSLYSYLLFHSMAEMFSVIISGGIFFVGWNSRKYMNKSFFLVLGVSSLFIGIFDLIHSLSYSEMQIFTNFDANLPTSLWIAARYLQSFSLLIASLLITKSVKPSYLLITYTMIFAILTILIFNNAFPICYIEGLGITPFKIISEYIIILIMLSSLLVIIKNRTEFDKKVFLLIICSTLIVIIAELAFTFYIGVTEFANLVGHLFRIIAFYLLYKSIIQIGIEKPFDLLLRKTKRSELELKNIIKHSGAGITMLDENGRYLLINEKAANDLGGNPEDFIGKTLFDIFPKETAEDYLSSNRDLIEYGKSRAYQRTFDLPIGKKTYWIVEQPLNDSEETNSSLLSVTTDITELKLAEDEIKKREYDLKERIKELTCLYNISKLTEQFDVPNKYIFERALFYILPAWQFPHITCVRILYKDEEFKTANFKETKWFLKSLIKEFGKIIGSIEVFYLEKLPEKDEGPFFKDERSLINAISEMIGSFIERKSSGERIRNLSRFPSENPNPVLRVNNKRVIYINRIGLEMFNIDEGSLIPDFLELSIQSALEKKVIQELELKVNSQIYSLVITPVENEDYVNIYGMDITERKQAEQRLSHLISTVSHELRTPITVLLMSIEFLTKNKESLTDELEERLINAISRNIQLLNQLAEDILLMSRIDEHRFELDLKKFNLLEVINEILYLMEPIANERLINFVVDVDNTLELLGDPKRIDQVFRIIIDNAIKYSPENSKVEIRATDNYQGKYNNNKVPGVLFEFKDYGRGIPKEEFSHIFERFFRASNVHGVSGSGLGLAIAKDIIEAHNGNIIVESELDKGTICYVFFPQTNELNKF